MHLRGLLILALTGGGLVLLPGAGVPQAAGPVFVVPVHGEIELGLAPFVERSLREAKAAGARAVILDLETPGGRVDAAQRITNAVADSEVPVFAFVNRHAYSAGAMIALSARRIYMRPGSVMGAATPVVPTGEKAPEKIVSAMRSQMRALAEIRGLDPRVAEAMVDEEIEIPGVVEAGKLLTLTTQEAVKLGYAVEVEDFPALVAALDLAGAEVRTSQINWAERIVRFLTSPLVSPFLLSLGFLGLLVEIKSPGFGMAGLAGLVSLTLFFGSHLILGLAGIEELLLLGAGIILLAVEIFFIPGFGLLGVMGGIAIVGALFMSLVGGIPTMADFAQAGVVLSTSLLILMVTSWALLRHLPHSGRLARSGIFLATRGDRSEGWTSVPARPELVGREGTALTDLRPAGTVLIGDERVDAVSEAAWIEHGARVKVVRSEGYRLVVRALPALESGESHRPRSPGFRG